MKVVDTYKFLMDNLPVAFAYHQIITDSYGKPVDYIFIDINQAFEEILDVSREKLIGRRVTEVFPTIKESAFDWIGTYGYVASTGQSIRFEQYYARNNQWYDIIAFSYEKGRLAVLVHDITAIKQENEVLRNSQDWFSNLFRKAPIGIVFVDTSGNVLKSNSRAIEIFGAYPQGEHNKIVNVFKPPFDRASLAMRACLAEKDLQIFEDYYPYEGSESLSLRYRMNPKYDDSGEIIGVIISVEDITERQKAEQKLQEAHQQLGQIIEHLPDATFVVNQEGQVMFWNRAIEKMTGIPKEQMIGRGDYEYAIPFYGERRSMLIDLALLPDSEYGRLKDNYDFIHQDGDTFVVEVYVPKTYGGQGAYLLGSASRLYDLNGKAVGAIESIRDITERKEMENRLFYEKEQLKTTLLSIGDGFISTDKNGKVILLNQVTEQLTGWTQGEAFGKPLEDIFCIIDEFTRERCENPVHKVLETGDIIEQANHAILISKDGTERPIEDIAAPIKDDQKKIHGVVLVFRDITTKKEKQAEIEYLSSHDQLTGLHNRRFYEEELNQLDNEKNLPLTLVMADVNGLKLVNDAFGHINGDLVLIKVAELIKKTCRPDDTVVRLGGDEFIILLPKTGSKEAEHLVDSIRTAIHSEKCAFVNLSISFGWASKNEVDENMEEIYKRAEDAMYRHKLWESPSMRSNSIKTIIQTMYQKLPGEKEHSDRVSYICERIGIGLGYSSDKIAELKTVGLIHDIGKIILDEAILHKPSQLDDWEWAEVKRHPETGYRILSSVNEMSQLAEYILAHHENWDGTGYPKGLQGEEIPLQSRIIRVADSYDAMTSDRCYRSALSKAEAIEEIEKKSGTIYDPEIARVFLQMIK